MNLQIKPLLFTIWTLAATLLPLRAQIVADGATNTLSNVTNNFTRDVTVGTNGSFTLLVLSDNTLLTGSANVIIGRNTTAKSNEVRLVSSSARWQLGGLFAFPTVYVGSNGAFNRLVVSNGATVSAFSGYVGVQPPASNNLALVTGPGSVWSMASLDVGSFSAGNQVIVSNGGVLYCAGSTIGTFPGGSNNLAVVTGSGSTWTNQSGLTLGLFGTGNQVLVSEGGALHNGHGSLGSDPAGSNNVALITGTGSVWSNALDLEIGSSSANNQMIVSNGAAVFAAGNGLIGSATNANGNSVTVTDPGTSWLIGNTLYVGSNGILNRLALNGGATASVGRDALIGGRAGANSNSVSVADTGTRWEIATNLYLGSNAMFNRLVVSNGATVANYSAIVGFSPLSLAFSGSSNEVVVTGVGSLWSNANTLSVGWTANGNRLVISNGAVVRSFTANICESLSSNNVVVVTDSGSAWTNQSALTVGLNGPLNRLIVTNAAVVDSGDGFIGGYSYSSNCEALITGAGSLWRNRANLTVGVYEGFSRLVVTNNGAAIALGAVVLGEFFGSTNNRIIVDGGALRATNAAGTSALNLIRGTNRFNAGVIEADQLIMTSTQGFFEFNGGTLITRGAVISNGLPFVVGASGATPAVWDVRAGVSNYFLPSDLYVGSNSSLNQLVITNSAFLTNSFLTLGVNPGANSNAITLSGAGSRYSLVAFNVGNGSFNRLVLSNGGSLNTSSSDFGVSSASSNNSAVVTGAGSVWTNLGFLVLGDTGRSNQLLVSDGGRVVSTSSDIGAFTASSDNVALVTGSDSVWNTLDTLAVGNNGPRNRLQVSNGGLVTAVNAVLVGAFNASTNNRLVVDGGALLVTNGAATGLLDIRRGTNVLTAGWIEVDELRVTNGGLSKFEFNGGTLSAKNSRLGLGIPFVI